MKNNIFIKSVFRQPVRAVILFLLLGAAAFALVARVTEFVVVRGEINRIEDFYRAVGVLSPLRSNNFTIDHDVTRALEIVESHPNVVVSDRRRFVQGVLHDRNNLVTHWWPRFFNPAWDDLDVLGLDHYFIGYLTLTPRLLYFERAHPRLIFQVAVEEVLIGDTTVLREGNTYFTNEFGQTSVLLARYEGHITVTDEQRAMFIAGEWNPLYGLELGERALFRATPALGYEGLIWHVLPLAGEDVYFILESDEEAINTTLAGLQDKFAMLEQNMSSVTIIETRDLSAMPRFNDPRATRMLDTARFPAGRWLNYEDYGRPVAVVQVPFVTRRGLRMGETFTVTLRNNPRPGWIDTPTESDWARGIENWWDNHPHGWWNMLDSARHDWRDFETYELTLEVVGIYWFTPRGANNFTSSEIFIPAGLIPEGFGWEEMPQLTGMYSFILDSPRSQEAFVRQTRSALIEQGFVATFMPTGYDTLVASTEPIRFSITVNLLVFGIASVIVFMFVIFLYIRQWRNAVAIAQALGMPRGKVLRRLFVPVVCLWLPAVIAGSVGAWFFALAQAENVLAAFADYGAEVLMGLPWLFLFGGSVCAFLLLGVYTAGQSIVRRPVLEQLQGGTVKRQKIVHIASGEVPEGFVAGAVSIPTEPLPARRGAARLSSIRHRLRHIVRMPLKTALVFILSMLLVLSLGWLHDTLIFTEAEIERLWRETVVEGEIFIYPQERATPGGAMQHVWHMPLIAPALWDMIADSGFIQNEYLEAFAPNAVFGVSHLAGFIAENTRTPADEQMGLLCDNLEITFLPGFGEEDFVFTSGAPVPVIIPLHMTESGEIPLGEPFVLIPQLLVYVPGDMWDTRSMTGQVIGTFEGGLERAILQFEDVFVVPLDAHRAYLTGTWPFVGVGSHETGRSMYHVARFSIDPARNQEIDDFREMVEAPLFENFISQVGRRPLLLHISHDDVFDEVIAPMEQSLSLLRVLYPIAVGSAFVLALGLSLLNMLQNAKNAAIMRVLGKTKGAVQTALVAEQLIVCMAGILAGFAAMLIFGVALGTTPLALAGLYLAGALIGSAAGAFIISVKAPLELLQVKE